MEARTGFEPVDKGFADLCLTTWLPRLPGEGGIGAGDRVRTGDIDLGKVALYQLSYSRVLQ